MKKGKDVKYIAVSISYLEKLLAEKENVLKNIDKDSLLDDLQKASAKLDYARLEGTINYAKIIIKEGKRIK